MRQVLQDLKTGAVVLMETPDPAPAAGRVLVRVQASLLSAGTESAQIARGRQSLLAKIREKPQLIQRGLAELRERGLTGIRGQLAARFEGFAELGYSCAGTVVHCGDGRLPAGSLVACAGAGAANHAEFVSVPPLLTAAVPEGVSAEAAAYTTVGAIALQGARQSAAQLGETVAVIGLGLVGLITAQLLRAAGCRVVGIDPAPAARRRGQECGCDLAASPETAVEAALELSLGYGADAVIICAATPASAPVELAGKLARSRGRVVMVGATGMTIPREEYYLKELSFTLSRSYGPGRYDRAYEDEGQDYPIDYVRFTEQRNMRAFLELAQKGAIHPASLTTHRFPVEQAAAAYQLLGAREVDRAGIILQYPASSAAPAKFSLSFHTARSLRPDAAGVGFLGAGAYASGMLLPLLKERADVALRAVLTRNGARALQAARRFGFATACTRLEEVLENPAISAVFIATRHDSHAELACRALRAGKHVWVEKPLALSLDELREVARALREHPELRLVVGFNRPFSPDAAWLAARLGNAKHRLMHYRINAGAVPASSWVHDPAQGGGRLLGEGCHFFDFLRHFAGARAVRVSTETTSSRREDLRRTENFAATVAFDDGSAGQVLYTAQGAPAMAKESFECFTGGVCGAIHDFKAARFFQGARQERRNAGRQDKGQANLLTAFLASVREGGPPPMTPDDLIESSLITLAAQGSLIEGRAIEVEALRRQLALPAAEDAN